MVLSMAGMMIWWWSRDDDRSITNLEEELRREKLSLSRRQSTLTTAGPHEQHGLPLEENCLNEYSRRKRGRRRRMSFGALKMEKKVNGTVLQSQRSMKRDQLSKEYFLTRNKHIPRAKRFK